MSTKGNVDLKASLKCRMDLNNTFSQHLAVSDTTLEDRQF
jgi:hypothetical protein